MYLRIYHPVFVPMSIRVQKYDLHVPILAFEFCHLSAIVLISAYYTKYKMAINRRHLVGNVFASRLIPWYIFLRSHTNWFNLLHICEKLCLQKHFSNVFLIIY